MKNYVYEVEVEDFDDLEYCGCEHSTRIKRYGLYSSLDAGILAVEDKEGPIIKDLLRGEDFTDPCFVDAQLRHQGNLIGTETQTAVSGGHHFFPSVCFAQRSRASA